jgi:Ca2+:H+ antiporter
MSDVEFEEIAQNSHGTNAERGAEDEDEIQQQPAQNPKTVKRMQEELIHSHPFGIKIWKPALYKKHRSIDQQTYDDLHKVPGSLPIDLSLPNLLWALLFGWWIALIYMIVIGVFLAPVYLVGLIGRAIFIQNIRDYGQSPKSSIAKFFENLSTLIDYIFVLYNLAGYIFWPFGKFVAKKFNTTLDHVEVPPAEVPLMSSNDYDSAPIRSLGGFIPQSDNPFEPIEPPAINPLSGREARDEWDSASEEGYNIEAGPSYTHHRNVFSKALKSGTAGFYFFVVVLLILGPIHLATSAIMFFFVLPIPMSKLNYYLLRHILRHPLTLSAHWAEAGIRMPRVSARSGIGSGGVRSINPNSGRPKSVFFWRSESALAESESEENLPTIMATPSLIPAPDSNAVMHGPDYMIILCTYRAMGMEYARYTVDGINIIFINLISAIVFTLINFYILGPLNGFTGISSKPIIFLSGILSTVPLSYFIGMAVSSVTAQTGSVAVGAVVNATFGSIIEILLYAFGLMNGKEELVQGAIIGSFLLGLLALPGAAMFSGGLNRVEQRFNSKSASVTSTMLVVAVICVFTPTIFQNIHGTYQFECKSCPIDTLIHPPASSCRNCMIKQPHPTEDPIYLTSTRPLMYICAVVLVLTYAIGLLFTLRTHSHKIYGPKKKRKKISSSRRNQSTNKPNFMSPPSRPTKSDVIPMYVNSSDSSVPVKRRKVTKISTERPVSIVTPAEYDSSTSMSDNHDNGHPSPEWVNLALTLGSIQKCINSLGLHCCI